MGEKKEKLYYSVQYVLDEIFQDISKDSLVRLIERKEIPSIRITNKYFIPKWWVDEKIDFALNPPEKEV